MIKRESSMIVSTGIPLCTVSNGYSKSDPKLIEYLLKLSVNNSDKEDPIFYQELVKFISRHFIDDRIANPDLKEIYLVRMNILLQHNHFMRIFESQQYAQENMISMLMRSFSKNINLRHVTKNILRLAKG
jgi:hypothetical protein